MSIKLGTPTIRKINTEIVKHDTQLIPSISKIILFSRKWSIFRIYEDISS